jgi:uncharacterized protein
MPAKLSKDLVLPDTAVTQTFAFLARKGAGKTHNAGVLTEELLDLHAPVVVLDPVGTWWGLRLLADGKKPGFNIPVFGGDHADIPLRPDQGAQLGKLLVENNLAAVIDVSAMRKNERVRFVAAFAENFYFFSRQERTPRMLVLEEAQVFAPQNGGRGIDDLKMLGAIEDIVRLGRNYGIGSCMISQRPQSINKEVLNQVECLFVGQLNAAHERKAIEDWVADHKAAKEWTKELPSLPVGEMIVWSPQWLKVMKKVKINRKRTFDASATPELGKRKKFELAALDVDGIKAALEQTDEKPATVGAIAKKAATDRSAELAEAKAQLEALRHNHAKDREFIGKHLLSMKAEVDTLVKSMQELRDRIAIALPIQTTEPRNFFLNERQELPPDPPLRKIKATKPAVAKPLPGASEGVPQLKSGNWALLQVLVAFYPGSMTRQQVARGAKMKASGGTFKQYWSLLKRYDYIEDAGTSLYRASEDAVAILGATTAMPKDFNSRVAYWEARFKSGAVKMLRKVISADSHGGLSREGLAAALNMEVSGGTFKQYLGDLVRNRLIVLQDGRYRVHGWLKGERE